MIWEYYNNFSTKGLPVLRTASEKSDALLGSVLWQWWCKNALETSLQGKSALHKTSWSLSCHDIESQLPSLSSLVFLTSSQDCISALSINIQHALSPFSLFLGKSYWGQYTWKILSLIFFILSLFKEALLFTPTVTFKTKSRVYSSSKCDYIHSGDPFWAHSSFVGMPVLLKTISFFKSGIFSSRNFLRLSKFLVHRST